MAHEFFNNLTETGTDDLARRIGARLRPGDTILLSGDIGAGKTRFARALILSLLDGPEDVPSPTFTLVQTYASPLGEIWHADLYRLSMPEELDELGLSEAFDTAVCLIEWPERMGAWVPPRSVQLRFDIAPDGEDLRRVTLTAAGSEGAALVDRLKDV